MGDPSCNERIPPLRIVLGTLNNSPDPANNNNVGLSLPSSPSSSSAVAQASAATYILGTSYFATPRIGIGSPPAGGSGGSRRSVLKLNKDGRVPGEDRKGPFDHLKSRSLVLSTVRVTAINISTTLSTFFSDQLSSEQRVEEMVDSGEITSREADEMNEEWENREWQLRTNLLPKKIGWAILRFHASTALMRFYEFVMARYILQVDGDSGGATCSVAVRGSKNLSVLSHEQAIVVMDKLTRDPFQASLRTSQLLRSEEHSPGMVISSDGTETSTNRELTKRMFSTCIWANIIPFLAELTVQQLFLIYGYGVYYMAKKKRRQEREELNHGESEDQCKEEDVSETQSDTENSVSESAYALSLMFRSSRLTIGRSMSWIAASAGGSLGSAVYPGWGTVFGNQIGDAVVGALID